MVAQNYTKVVLKIIVIIILLGIFYKSFFIDIVKQYREKKTVQSSEDQPFVEGELGFKSPAITLCPLPNRKQSILKQYNITEAFFQLSHGSYEDLIGVTSLSEMVEEASFKFGTDFDIYFSDLNYTKKSFWGDPLSLGVNVKKLYETPVSINLTETATLIGRCYLVRSNASILVESNGLLLSFVKSIASMPEDDIAEVQFTITSDADYMASVMPVWKSLKPHQFTLQFGQGLTNIDLKEKTTKLIKNCDDQVNSYFECGSRKIVNLDKNCPQNCIHYFLKSFYEQVGAKYEICKDVLHDKCILDEVTPMTSKLFRRCKIQCKRTEYLGEVKQQDRSFLPFGNNSIELLLFATDPSRIVIEEYLIYQVVDLVGILGGSLGLFLGISFYSVISDLIDLFIKS